MKKFKSRLRDVRALWEKGVWQFEEKVANKQERMNGQGRQDFGTKNFLESHLKSQGNYKQCEHN